MIRKVLAALALVSVSLAQYAFGGWTAFIAWISTL